MAVPRNPQARRPDGMAMPERLRRFVFEEWATEPEIPPEAFCRRHDAQQGTAGDLFECWNLHRAVRARNAHRDAVRAWHAAHGEEVGR